MNVGVAFLLRVIPNEVFAVRNLFDCVFQVDFSEDYRMTMYKNTWFQKPGFLATVAPVLATLNIRSKNRPKSCQIRAFLLPFGSILNLVPFKIQSSPIGMGALGF